ncbi:deazapurine DNA modification protein DpdA family protein [Rhizobium rhizogenes]|uniref:deazapurine DNA modification protein DpdA family protein n=1 Tax=Rhizobium rhizogenes TaxID=359 RepID=UPI001573AAEF|nr:hypothetical protein [Rhizobium rhizogenes]NTF67917.1 hypothetical protein [Rhizobium rhizogenes]
MQKLEELKSAVKFYVGLHQPADAQHFDLACISINRLRGRKKSVDCGDVLVDSGAFTELLQHGRYRHSVEEYANEVRRLHESGVVKISAAVAQDYMCEPFMLKKTAIADGVKLNMDVKNILAPIGDEDFVIQEVAPEDKFAASYLTPEQTTERIRLHQRLTIERYDALFACNLPVPVLPVLQGFAPSDYADHVRQYDDRLKFGMWVGVGSVCKRQGDPRAIIAVLQSIRDVRPDLRLHGFGVKRTSLLHPGVREYLYSADSMAWSFAARKQGRNANDWREAKNFTEIVNSAANAVFQPWQMEMFG